METLPNKITLNLGNDSEVSVKGFIAPIEYTGSNFHVEWDALANLRVAEPEKQYAASVFLAFLPPVPVSVGELWQIEQDDVLELLKQLHPDPYLNMHIDAGDSEGLWACLRAYNDKFADIVFRVHAEFTLKDGWFTPSQFAGHLVIDRIAERVASFKMHVPEGTLNFDVNWKRDKDDLGFFTDSGFCPRMELRAGTQDVVQDIEFTEAIIQEEAEHKLILRFYEWQRINWVPLDKALEMAEVQQKPIHAISVDGPLADESC